MSTLIDQNIAPARRIRMQRTMRPRMRCAWTFTPARSRIGRRLLPLRRRRARIVRRLRRQTELRLKLRHPRRKRQNQVDQGFLVQRLKGLAIYPIRKSDPTALVKAADPNCLEPVTSEIRLEIGLNNYPKSPPADRPSSTAPPTASPRRRTPAAPSSRSAESRPHERDSHTLAPQPIIRGSLEHMSLYSLIRRAGLEAEPASILAGSISLAE